MDDILHRFNPWWDSDFEFPGIARETYLTDLTNLQTTKDVVLVTGLRRVGKTTLLHQFIHQLLEQVEKNKIFYVSLDNLALKDHTIPDIIDTFRRICSLKHDEHAFLFLDEVIFKKILNCSSKTYTILAIVKYTLPVPQVLIL